MRHLIPTSVALEIVCAAAAHPGDLGGGTEFGLSDCDPNLFTFAEYNC